jgi:uncharacterized protein involved in outer membrane biogenesis
VVSGPVINPTRQGRRWLRASVVGVALIVALMAGLAVGEWFGWPFLKAPVERLLSDALERRVRFSHAVVGPGQPGDGFSVHFLGTMEMQAQQLEIAAPAWSRDPHLLLAQDVVIELRYSDLWRAYRGQVLHIKRLQAQTLDSQLERLADGRSSWQFGPVKPQDAARPLPMPVPLLERLQVGSGSVRYRDALMDADLQARLSLTGARGQGAKPQHTTALHMSGQGHYRKQPVMVDLLSSDVLPWVAAAGVATPVPLVMKATVGRASMVFNGVASDALHLNGMKGTFTLKGPSLAAVGDLLGVTLPTTAAFRADGLLARDEATWHVVIKDATVGASRMNGAFTYETGRKVPLLSGQLGGQRLMLIDLGPVVGTTPVVVVAKGAAPVAVLTNSAPEHGKVLPDRPFDLAALRAMDANVLIDIAEVDLNTRFLEPLHPLHAHLQLAGGTLKLHDIRARTGQGQLTGAVTIDGRQSVAAWDADVRIDGVRLEHLFREEAADGKPRLVSGTLSGQAVLQGQGRSTADMLGTLKGHALLKLTDATVSHLAIEKAGLDLAGSLVVMLKGDDQLPVQCAVADLVAQDGVLRPRVMVLDTAVSAVWVEGALSLATEALDLRAVVMPKDFSLASLRTPLRVRGSFAHPEVSFQKGTMGLRLGTSFLLALVNPLGALIPLVDPGDAAAAQRGATGCRALMQRVVNHKAPRAVTP